MPRRPYRRYNREFKLEAVREVAELILKAQNKWTRLIADYTA